MIKHLNILTETDFVNQVTDIVVEHDISYIDAIVHFCEKNEIEIEAVVDFVKKNDRLFYSVQVEASRLNMLTEKITTLPI